MKAFSTYFDDLVEYWKSSSRAGESLSVDVFWCLKITQKIHSKHRVWFVFFVKQFVSDHSCEEEGGLVIVFFFNFMLVLFSDFSMLAKNAFLDVFGTSQEVSQDSFWGHPGYLLGQLLGRVSVSLEITSNNKSSMSFCLWALGKAKRIMSLCFLICFEGGQSNENIFEKENTMSVAFERFPIAVCTWLHFFDYSGWTTSISIRINVAEEKGWAC